MLTARSFDSAYPAIRRYGSKMLGVSVDLYHKVGDCRDFKRIGLLAEEYIRSIGGEVVKVSGPLMSGGFGNLDQNYDRFSEAVEMLKGRGLFVFDDRIFEDQIVQIHRVAKKDPRVKKSEIENFRGRILQEHLIKQVFFLPGFMTSDGSSAEETLCEMRGIKRIYPLDWCPKEWVDELAHHS